MSDATNKFILLRWCAFTDAAQTAPDTDRSPAELAERYECMTGRQISPDAVAAMMPENR